MIDNIENIHTFAEKLLLIENDGLDENNFLDELDYSFNHVRTLINSNNEYHDQYKYELRLRLAMHFSPIDAIKYDSHNSYTRSELIENHLIKFFKKNKTNANKLAIVISNILDNIEEKRDTVTKYREILLKQQDYKCNHCHVKFILDNGKYRVNSSFKKDDYKPYSYPSKKIIGGNIEYTVPEVDHIQPVSAMGSNGVHNLQVLCKLCNRAKSDLLTVKMLNELKYAAYSIDQIKIKKPTHIHKMLYFTIHKANKKCKVCSKNRELTMRKVIKEGPFIRSNLRAVCKNCALKIDKGKIT